MPEGYDIAVIGGGPGGYVAAIRAAQLGAKVALVEKDRLGGTCLNRGCIPSKAMVHDAELYRAAASGEYCVEAEGGLRVNFGRLMARKRAVVDTLVEGVEHLMDSHRITVLRGQGRLLGPGRMEVTGPNGQEELTSRAIILATGSVPAIVPLPGNDLPGVMTSDGLFEITTLPKSMVVVGASVVGMEFACLFQALGTQVTVLGRKTFLREAEQQLAKRLRVLLGQRGMAIAVGLEFRAIARGEDGMLRVAYEQNGKEQAAEGEIVLLATGRLPFTAGLGLAEVGVAMKGPAIAVNEYLETSVPGIWAIGDCIGGYMLAHVASYEGEVAVDNILGKRRAADYHATPSVIFTMPEIADVGLTEAEAKEAGLEVQVSRFPFNTNGRAVAMGEAEGQVRLICRKGAEGHGGEVLGVHIMGPRAGDMIAEATLAMQKHLGAEEIATTMHAHPTVPEAFMEAAMAQLEGAIHFERK